MTVHRALQLPVQHGSTPKYQSLSNENFHQSYAMLKNAGLFIIDEISMISNVMLTYIHKRLQEIFGVFDHIFGSRNVVVFGDLLQLTSVTHDSCFADFAKAEIELLNSISSVNIWKEVEYDELTINMRQRGDDRFQKILNDVRLGFILPEDEAFLTEKCLFKYATCTVKERQEELAIFLMKEMELGNVYSVLQPTNKGVRELNEVILNKLPHKTYHILSNDSICSRGFRKSVEKDLRIKERLEKLESDPRNTAGLERKLNIKIGAKVMLKRNLNVAKKLCNGSIGEILKLIVHPETKKILKLRVQFEHSCEEIERIACDFHLPRGNSVIQIRREQFPLQLAWSITIHKAQGITLKHAMVDCGKLTSQKGQIYVGMSRVVSSDSLLLLGWHKTMLKCSSKAVNEYDRLRKMINLPPL